MIAPLLYNATITGFSISAAFEIGLLDQLLCSTEGVDLASFCKDKNLDFNSTKSMLFSMQCFGIINFDPLTMLVTKGAEFDQVYENKGYFLWMLKGYGKCLMDFPRLLSHQNNSFERDGGAIALAGKDYGEFHIDSYVETILSQITWSKIADLGCGSANRILQIAKKWNCHALGVEIVPDAVAIAKEAIISAGMENSVQISQGDINQLTPKKEFEDVDLITSFFNGHDLWPRENCINIFRHLKTCFPKLKYFLFCDTFRSDLPPSQEIPMFTLGFEILHSFMRQYIPSINEWRILFKEAGWDCIQEIETGIPYTNIFLLTPIKTNF